MIINFNFLPLHKKMENQGKRKDQIEFSEVVVSSSLIGILVILVVLSVYNYIIS